MIKIKKIKQTCFACPSQWEGLTDDGRPVYVRFRWGRLSVRLGNVGDEDGVGGEEVFMKSDENALNGVMEYEELKAITNGTIDWPEECLEWDIY